MDFFSPIIQAIMSFLSNIFGGIFGGGNTQNPKPSEITGIPISGAQGAIAPQAQAAAIAPAAPPKPSAEEIMASWKNDATIPQSVKNVIIAQEPQIILDLRDGKNPQEILVKAYAEDTKPEWDKFVTKSKAEISKLMDETIREVSQSGMSPKDKQAVIADLKKEKDARVKEITKLLNSTTQDQRIEMALNPDLVGQITKPLSESLDSRKANFSQLAAEHGKRSSVAGVIGDTSATVSKYSGYASLACFAGAGLCWVAGGIMTATGVGAVAGVPLMAAGTALGVSAGGYTLAASTATGLVAGASHLANGEITKGAVEAVFSLPGIGQIGRAGRIGKAVLGETAAEASELALKGGAVEGTTALTRLWSKAMGEGTKGLTATRITEFAPATEVIQTASSAAFEHGIKGFKTAISEGAEAFVKKTGQEAASSVSQGLANDARIIAEQAMRNGANKYVQRTVMWNGMNAVGNTGAMEAGEFVEYLTPKATPPVKSDAVTTQLKP